MLNLEKNKKYLLACSYGPDSMALLGMLKEEGYNFVAANINYNLRPESTKESEDLQEYCKKHDIKLFHLSFAGVFKGNLEKQCREIRYNFFKNIIKEYELDALLVGHHKDDLIETYLIQQKRGIIPEVYGLPFETEIFGIKVIRPLLNFEKKYLENYCKNAAIPHCIDSSNLENNFLRNQIRHSIVEALTLEEKDNLVSEINKKNEELEGIRSKLVNLTLNKETILNLDEKELQIFLALKAKKLDCSTNISKKTLREIRKVLNSKKANIELKISRNMMFEYSYGDIDLYKIEKTEFNFTMEKPSKIDNKFIYCDFSEKFINRNVKLDDFPIKIRNAKLDDVIQIKDYFVKIRRLFIDWKMPLKIRRKWPVIVNKDNKVIYIPRYQKDFVINVNLNFYVK